MTDSAVTRAGERLLETIAAKVPVAGIDRLWLFPGRRIGRAESALAVIALHPEADGGAAGRSRVVTYRFEVDASKQEPVPEGSFQEEGLVPPERVPALIEGVLRRLGDAPEELPRSWRVGGDAGRWEEIGREIGVGTVDGDFGE